MRLTKPKAWEITNYKSPQLKMTKRNIKAWNTFFAKALKCEKQRRPKKR